MEQPTVCAILLTRDRPELAAKAVECFRAQTYENKRLLILDSSEVPLWPTKPSPVDGPGVAQHDWDILCHIPASQHARPQTIGHLRNAACSFPMPGPEPEIFIHWDDDDHSHPSRIAEQVTLLQASGADAVGYNQMLFWREPRKTMELAMSIVPGEAWLYSHPLAKPTLGTSLCYWRKTWERKPFNPKLPVNSDSLGEDWDFIRGLNVHAVSSIAETRIPGVVLKEPRMIARIHGSNTVKYNLDESNGDTWKRVPEWDSRVREILG